MTVPLTPENVAGIRAAVAALPPLSGPELDAIAATLAENRRERHRRQTAAARCNNT